MSEDTLLDAIGGKQDHQYWPLPEPPSDRIGRPAPELPADRP
ncbi:hypothetical protein [Kitasatospora sp. NPDC127060]